MEEGGPGGTVVADQAHDRTIGGTTRGVGRSAYPGRTGSDGGGWRKLPPKVTPVPCDGGASPMTWVVPTVTSASGLPSRPTPTTPPVAPCPAETDTATRGVWPGRP